MSSYFTNLQYPRELPPGERDGFGRPSRPGESLALATEEWPAPTYYGMGDPALPDRPSPLHSGYPAHPHPQHPSPSPHYRPVGQISLLPFDESLLPGFDPRFDPSSLWRGPGMFFDYAGLAPLAAPGAPRLPFDEDRHYGSYPGAHGGGFPSLSLRQPQGNDSALAEVKPLARRRSLVPSQFAPPSSSPYDHHDFSTSAPAAFFYPNAHQMAMPLCSSALLSVATSHAHPLPERRTSSTSSTGYSVTCSTPSPCLSISSQLFADFPPPLSPHRPALSHSVSPHTLSPVDISPSPAVRLASALRSAFHTSPNTPLAFNPARMAPDVPLATGKAKPRAGRGKPTLELQASCWTCGEVKAKLIVRGEDINFPARASFTCYQCVVPDDEVESAADGAKGHSPSYADTISAAVDEFQGVRDINEEEQLAMVDSVKSLPLELQSKAMQCDVCTRIIGVGTVSSALPSPAQPIFTTEVVCQRCTRFYKPCSDCGGGGGRLTSGRWRCKELFPEGRRTCRLSHHRMPPLTDITYEVHLIRDIPPATAEDLEKKCREVYFNSRLGVIARPDTLERGDGLACSFVEIERGTIDGWHLVSPILREDVEATRGIRRYLSIQSSPQHGRRPRGKIEVVPTISPGSPPPSDRTMTGFMLIEHDLANGTVLFAVAMPWVLSGPSFDATTVLAETTVRKVKSDLVTINLEREALGLAPYPPVQFLWLLSPFQTESRWSKNLGIRGFCPIQDVMQQHPELNPAAFPPHREVYVPTEFLKGYQTFVRVLSDEDDLGGQPEVRRRDRKRKDEF